MPDGGSFISWFDAATVSLVVNALFIALLAAWRGRISDLKSQLALANERIDNLTEALEECYEEHEHGTDTTHAP